MHGFVLENETIGGYNKWFGSEEDNVLVEHFDSSFGLFGWK